MKETTDTILNKILALIDESGGKVLMCEPGRSPRTAELIPTLAANQQRVVTISFVAPK